MTFDTIIPKATTFGDFTSGSFQKHETVNIHLERIKDPSIKTEISFKLSEYYGIL